VQPTPDRPDPAILAAALDSTSPDNVSSSAAFLLARVLSSGDPAQCYSPDLIRALAATDTKIIHDASRRLKQQYGKDLNLNQFNRDVKAARLELSRSGTNGGGGLILSESGAIKPLLANAMRILAHDLTLGYDSFSARVTLREPSPWGSQGAWTDNDDSAASIFLQDRGAAVRSDIANEAAAFIAHKTLFHPVQEWLCSLSWDGDPRLDGWAAECLGAEDTKITRSFASKWMISAVARIMRPGCLAKYMIVLEGAQDVGKSKALRALVNGHLDGDTGVQWFRDNMPDIDHDDIGLYMQGVWVIEVAELSAIRGKQWERTKSFISSPRDSFRRKFGRNLNDYPRQCVFAGTTNEEHWAGDQTGNTRFWPIRTGRIDSDRILRLRDQLWAEARFRYDEGEVWWLPENMEAEAQKLQAQRTPEDAWASHVLNSLGMSSETSVAEMLSSIGVEKGRQSHGDAIRMGRVLTGLGFTRVREAAGERGYRWRRED
jgi:predicted P-loop ATPase